MTTAHKQNLFGLLHADSEGEEDVQPKQKTKKAPATNKEERTQTNVNKQSNVENVSKLAQAPKVTSKTQNADAAITQKEKNVRPKEPRKLKGVPAEPHPLDRHSGTGINPWDKKAKRSGGGKYNVGTVKDELKGTEEEVTAPAEETPVEAEPEDAGITLSEYYKLKGLDQESTQAQINEAKAKITADQLVKELGTAKPLQTKAQTQIDDRDLTKKKAHHEEHAAAINTEHADLLGFKTGFKTYTERPQGERRQPAPVTTQAQPAEGTQAQAPVEQGEKIKSPEQKERQTNNRGYYKGGDYKGGDYKGGRREGGQQQQKKVPVNFEDDKDFPKLG